MYLAVILSLFHSINSRQSLRNSTRDQVGSKSVYDEDLCCEGENCYFLGDGVCNQQLNTAVCNWDQGDCGYCSQNCYFFMISNGICDEECYTSSCEYDMPDCRHRSNIEIYNPEDSKNLHYLTVNGIEIKVSEEVESFYKNLSFINTTYLEGFLDFNSSNYIEKGEIKIKGNIRLSGFSIDSENFDKFNLEVSENGSVELSDFKIIGNFFYKLEAFADQNVKIWFFEYKEIDEYYLVNLKISYFGPESKKLIEFHKAERVEFNFKTSDSPCLEIFRLKSESEVSLEFDSKNSSIYIGNSSFKFNYTDRPLFTLQQSLLLMNNTKIYSNLPNDSNANLYFSLTNSNATIYESSLDHCRDLLLNISSNSIFELINSEFNNCEYSNLLKISHVITCLDQSCKSKYAFSKNCSDGEMDALGCAPCPDNYYRFKRTGSKFCFNCTESMICKSGQIWPKNGYYRFNETEYDHVFRPCLNKKACKGYDEKDEKTHELHYGKCAENYNGILCGSCDNNSDSSGNGSCQKCPEFSTNIVIILLSIIVVSAFIIYMIKSTVLSSFVPSEFYAIALRIGINYFQVIYLCLQFRINWPGNEENQPDDDKTDTSKKLTIMYSIKCLLEQITSDIDSKDYFYLKVGFMSLLPIIIFLFSLAYLAALKTYKISRKKKLNLKIYKPITFSVPYLLIYPYVITYSLLPLACNSLVQNAPTYFDERVDLSAYRYLMYNPDIQCTWDDHYRKIIWVTGFSLIVWGIGVPVFILFKLYKKRKNLFKFEVKYTFGFLISGYKHERFYWEFLIFSKKLVIVFLTVFMQSGYSTTLQSVLLITLLIIGFILQLYYQPYITQELNHLEIFGLLAAIITVLSAIIYTESIEKSENLIVFLTIILIFVNVSYIIYWASFLFKEFFTYLILNMDFLMKRFSKRDGFDRYTTQEFTQINFVYLKEFQKLYTHAEFNIDPQPNYLGESASYKNLLKEIIKSTFDDYCFNRGPEIRPLFRKPTISQSRFYKE